MNTKTLRLFLLIRYVVTALMLESFGTFYNKHVHAFSTQISLFFVHVLQYVLYGNAVPLIMRTHAALPRPSTCLSLFVTEVPPPFKVLYITTAVTKSPAASRRGQTRCKSCVKPALLTGGNANIGAMYGLPSIALVWHY